MAAGEAVIYDPNLLARFVSLLDDHFDLLSLSQTSKFHRQFILDSVQRITCRNLNKIEDLPQKVPNMTSLNLDLVRDKLTQDVFDDLMSHLPELEVLTIDCPRVYGEMKLENLGSIGKLGRLRVLNIGYTHLNDKVAEQIGKGCTCLEDLTVSVPKSSGSSLTKVGWSNLVFGSRQGLRRLSANLTTLKEDVFVLFLQCSSLISLSVRCVAFRFSNYGVRNLDCPRVELENLRELSLDLEAENPHDDSLPDYITVVCNEIIDRGARLEVFDCSNDDDETSKAVCECPTLSSFVFYNSNVGEIMIPELLSTNPNLVSLKIHETSDAINEAIMIKFAEVEGIRKGQSYAETGIVFNSFLKDHFISELEITFGVYERFSSKIKFLKEFSVVLWPPSGRREPYTGLRELFSVCTLLEKVNLVEPSSVGEGSKLCAALEALSSCHNLQDLSAPLGDSTLRHILSGVKGLRRLTVEGPVEVFSDASAFQLMIDSPLLHHFRLDARKPDNYTPIKNSGISDRGLKALSGCPQLQTLEFSSCGFDGSGLKHIAKRCLWLNFLIIENSPSEVILRNSRDAVQFLKNRGCYVLIEGSPE